MHENQVVLRWSISRTITYLAHVTQSVSHMLTQDAQSTTPPQLQNQTLWTMVGNPQLANFAGQLLMPANGTLMVNFSVQLGGKPQSDGTFVAIYHQDGSVTTLTPDQWSVVTVQLGDYLAYAYGTPGDVVSIQYSFVPA